MLHSIDGEGVAQPVWANAALPAGGRVHQVAKPGPGSATANDLPSTVSVDAENHLFAVLGHRTAALDVVSQKCQGSVVQGKGTHPTMLLLFRYYLIDFVAALWAEGMSLAEPGVALGAGDFYAGFQMLDRSRAVFKVDIIHSERNSL